jgi:hypothetical protein
LIIWDNYPVNDAKPTMHLGPITGRDPALCEVADGYMVNPMYPQNQIGRLPLYTMADYAYNPQGYDPNRSIGQAIMHLAQTPAQRQVLADLVEVYAGNLAWDNSLPVFNPVREHYQQLPAGPIARFTAAAYIRSIEQLAEDLRRAFPDLYRDAQQSLAQDVDFLKSAYEQRFGNNE